MRKILNIAHRGASGYKKENTIESFEEAVNLGADFIELDIQKTKDNQIVVFHDTRLDEGERVSELEFSYLKDRLLNKGIDLPLLEDVLSQFNHRIGINIEIKSFGIVDLLKEKLKVYNTENIIVSSFIHPVLKELKIKLPYLKLGMLVSAYLIDPLNVLNTVGTDLIIQNFEFVDKRYVDLLHSNNKKIFVWTVNEEKDMEFILDMGVEGIITDYPSRLKRLLGKIL
ncbi:MAG: glycerophosphodiester phosphodiesterase [Candidatus Omnitrophica bacterium]|nr:glycerophosphodiester phosphodiesterase [Candidatus Omnitrophota bacterium]